MNATHAISHWTEAEAALVASIDAATQRLDALGTRAVDAALARFHAATQAAAARFDRASSIVRSLSADVLTAASAVSREIAEALESDAATVPTPPAKNPEQVPDAEADQPADEEPASRNGRCPSWLRGGIVGAILGPEQDAPTVPPGFAQDGPQLFTPPETPRATPTHHTNGKAAEKSRRKR